ncbi:hypothetical protein ABZ419_03145 [Streptomyces cinnamoneus]|uniref:hypothetical protein n=1 Tax=Streptomyces cinnamoneus TaxID=53446 RepID=UPI0033CFFDEE
MITSTTSALWTDNAPCAGNVDYVPDESLLRGPKADLLDACAPLMQNCADACPYVKACFERVRPREGFDGVCAARLWVNGRLIAKADSAPDVPKLPSLAGVCGEVTGRRRHEALGEPLCGKCRDSQLRASSRQAGRANIRKRPDRADQLAAA